MDRNYLGRLTAANSERVLRALTHQQHLYPGLGVAQTLQRVCEGQGFPGFVGDQALAELGIDEQTRVGRLLRGQVRALAERMELAWQAGLADRVRVPDRQ